MSQQQELTRTDIARKMAKESRQGLKQKWYWAMPWSHASQTERRWNNTEQCCEAEREGARERRSNTLKIDSEDY